MKMLTHRTTATENAPFVLNDVKEHLRILHDDEDTAITNMAWTAAAEIEHFAQIALLTQTIRVTVFAPRSGEDGMRLPIGPVAEDDTPTVTIDGDAFTDFDFVSGNRPYVRWLAPYHNLSPDRITVEYTAGFGETYDAIPRDLYQAVLDQAAVLYDARASLDARELTRSPHMARIGARYRGVQS